MRFEDPLDGLLEAASRERPIPSAALYARILQDADDIQFAHMRRASQTKITFATRISSFLQKTASRFNPAGLAVTGATACAAVALAFMPLGDVSVSPPAQNTASVEVASDIETETEIALWLTGWDEDILFDGVE